ncbi:MAG: hypothetical protein ABJA67_12215 [Chthonomonadales bacterium]
MATPGFVAVGHNAVIYVSPDGERWEQVHVGKEGEIYRTVAIGNGVGIAIGSYGGDNITAITTNGKDWTVGKKEAGYVRYIRTLIYEGGSFIGYGGDGGSVGSSRPFEFHSTDGKTWSEFQDVGGPHMLRRIAAGAGKFVGVGDRGRLSASPDGRKDWKDVVGTTAKETLVDVAFGNGIFVGVGLNSLRMRTKDGMTWSDKQIGEEGEHLTSIVWTGTQFTAIGIGATFFSADGVAWKRESNKNAPLTATFGNGVYVGAKWKGRVLLSKDAIDWREVLKSEFHMTAIAFGAIG